MNDFVLLSGRANPQLARDIAHILRKELYEPVSVFSDGEIRVKIPPNLRRRHVFIIQPTSPPVNDHLMELIFMVDAAKRSSAKEVTVVIPYFGYSRQDRKEMPHVPISSSVVASMITSAGADRVVTVDIHSEQQQGFFKGPWDNLYGSYSLVPVINSRKLKNPVIAAPDKGGMTRATGYARLLNASDVAVVYKERDVDVNNKSEAMAMIGEVKGRDVLLVDDMIDTAGTTVNAASYLKQKGARSVRAIATHGLFSGPALERIKGSKIDEVIITDSIKHPEAIRKHSKITIVTIAPMLAEAIRRIETGESISRTLIL
ncbi:MAG: ribose-phosphate pyrophosphokinase [Candidatus Levybacteria bacterium]|nr:ribose-phosphate pyrophosphokinase [Candidatus Levybacteria bacterium]